MTSGIRAASILGQAALEADFDYPVLESACISEAILRLGPVGCSMAERMIKAGEHTVITRTVILDRASSDPETLKQPSNRE